MKCVCHEEVKVKVKELGTGSCWGLAVVGAKDRSAEDSSLRSE